MNDPLLDAGNGLEPLTPGVSLGANPFGITWGVGDATRGVGLAVAYFVGLIFVILTPVAAAFGEDSGAALFASSAVTALWHVGVVFIVYRSVRGSGGSWRHLGLRLPWSQAAAPGATSPPIIGIWGTLGLVFAGYVSSIIVVLGYQAAVRAIGLDSFLPDQQIPDDVLDRTWLLPILGLSIMITAPFAEELLFRGFLFASLRRRMPFLPASMICGVLFSLAHLQVGLIIPFMLVAMVLAFAYERSRSIIVPVGIHFVFNSISFIVLAVDAISRS